MKISSFALHGPSVWAKFFDNRSSRLMPWPEKFFSARLVRAEPDFSSFGR